MEYKIAVCDDCMADADYLAMLVERWAKKAHSQVRILKFNSAGSLLFHYDVEKDFDILLLDIEIDGQNGVELAKEIRRNNDVVQIVFITGFPDYMAQGYEVDALHYLLKPVCEEKLCDVLGRAAARLKKTERCLKVTFDRQTDLVAFDRIQYIEARKQFVEIHTDKQIYRMKISLCEMENLLDQRFFRCQRSFLVNLCFVVRIKNSFVVLRNGEEIPIGRGKAKEIARAVIEFF